MIPLMSEFERSCIHRAFQEFTHEDVMAMCGVPGQHRNGCLAPMLAHDTLDAALMTALERGAKARREWRDAQCVHEFEPTADGESCRYCGETLA